MTTPLVSVAIISYNHKIFLRETIESILQQQYGNIEIVIGDDCSSDGSQEMLLEYESNYPGKFVIILHHQNVGITNNCNAVHFACSGKYIAWMGSDDLMAADKIKKQVALMESDPGCNLVYHNLDVFESETGKTLYTFNNSRNSYAGDVHMLIRYGTFNGACSTMVRRSASPEKGFSSELPVASDWFYWIEHLIGGGHISYIDEVLGRYRRHAGNVTDTISPFAEQAFKDTVKTCDILLERMPEYRKEINRRLSEIYRSGRKFDFTKNLMVSIKLNPFNYKSIFLLLVYYMTFKKVKK